MAVSIIVELMEICKALGEDNPEAKRLWRVIQVMEAEAKAQCRAAKNNPAEITGSADNHNTHFG